MPAAWIMRSPATLSSDEYLQREVESEIAFMIGEDLPPRETPYTAEDVLDVVIGCHPAIEILQSRFASPAQAGGLNILADLIQHGAFVWGQAIEDWQEIDFAAVPVEQTISGGETKTATGNPAGDMVRLMLWLANEGAVWAGGLKAGHIVTCGSWTGKTVAQAGTEVVTSFECADPVVLRFEDPAKL
jgi:2-keto-4-pentenoate hydratase